MLKNHDPRFENNLNSLTDIQFQTQFGPLFHDIYSSKILIILKILIIYRYSLFIYLLILLILLTSVKLNLSGKFLEIPNAN